LVLPRSASAGNLRARLLAFYLPQFHPIPENDSWWGPGFTEWTNVVRAKPLYPGHDQPRVPADLGYYDLRVPEVRAAQAELAKRAGIEGFCYWHYWFAGKRLLERPFNEVLVSKEPDFPFCLAWANQTWSGVWHGDANRVLMEQTYPGPADHEKHFYSVLSAFHDPRYIRVNGAPLFVIYRPTEFPELARFIEQWQKLAAKNGLPGIHFVAHLITQDLGFPYAQTGFAAATIVAALKVSSLSLRGLVQRQTAATDGWRGALRTGLYAGRKVYDRLGGNSLAVYHYRDAMRFFLDGVKQDQNAYPCIVPNWDNSPRSGRRAMILHGSTPELFAMHAEEALRLVADREPESRIVFVKSWNEWAEGNYLEPDRRFGTAYLDTLGRIVRKPHENHRNPSS
jgi:hypothetical protein